MGFVNPPKKGRLDSQSSKEWRTNGKRLHIRPQSVDRQEFTQNGAETIKTVFSHIMGEPHVFLRYMVMCSEGNGTVMRGS